MACIAWESLPRSLRNILREVEEDLGIDIGDARGDLRTWADRGVLLLNTVLTVRAGEAGSHRRRGWEGFTDAVLSTLAARPEPISSFVPLTPARSRWRRSAPTST